MLGSITPLGERGRNQRWGVTMASFLVGSAAGGTAAGALLGAAGAPLVRAWISAASGRAVALGILLVVGAALDGGIAGVRLPTSRRQVNEDWLGRYRGWVYGGAFGFQLGTGLATVVSSSAVYVTFAAAFLSGSAFAGAALGFAFGLVRALPSLATIGIRTPADVARLGGRLRRWGPASGRVAIVALAVLGLSAFVVGMA